MAALRSAIFQISRPLRRTNLFRDPPCMHLIIPNAAVVGLRLYRRAVAGLLYMKLYMFTVGLLYILSNYLLGMFMLIWLYRVGARLQYIVVTIWRQCMFVLIWLYMCTSRPDIWQRYRLISEVKSRIKQVCMSFKCFPLFNELFFYLFFFSKDALVGLLSFTVLHTKVLPSKLEKFK